MDINGRLIVALLVLASSGLLLAATAATATAAQPANLDAGQHQQNGQPSGPIQSRIHRKLSILFDFPKYKLIFNKNYRNLAEELNRARLFFARAFKVFIARIKYIYGSSNKYLAINELSDWSPAERDSMYRLDVSGFSSALPSAEVSGTDLETVERKLVEIVQRKDEAIEFKQIADQLEQQQQSRRRRKRNVAAARRPIRRLPEEELIHEPIGRISPVENPAASYGISSLERQQIEGESSKAAAAAAAGSLDAIVDSLHSSAGTDNNDASNSTTDAGGDSLGENRVLLDYRESGCVGPVKMQHRCGACYIFATLELYEYQYCLKTGKHVRLSEQYIIDCGLQKGLKGCAGGSTDQVAGFIERFGLELNEYYGYKATNRVCPYDLNGAEKERELAGRVRVTPWSEFRSFTKALASNQKIESFLESRGPMVIAVSPNDEFADYGGGVDWLQNGQQQQQQGGGRGHAMALIGHGIEDGREYWLIKNSHGLTWGERGYYKLDKRVDAINAYRFDHLKAEFTENSQHDVERVRQKISENLPLHEKMLAWTGFYNCNE